MDAFHDIDQVTLGHQRIQLFINLG